LQTFVANVSSVFSDVCCKSVYLDVHMFHTYVVGHLSKCCVYLQWFQVFFQVFL
jgi:hypothetical protein